MIEQVVEAARKELVERTLDLTQRFLQVHELDRDRPPYVAVSMFSADTYLVYHVVRDHPYWFQVIVSGELVPSRGSFCVVGTDVAAEVRAYLAIASTQLTADEITAQIGIPPTSTQRMGAQRGRSPVARYDKHAWILEPERYVPGGVDEKVAGLLEAVYDASERIAGLRDRCSVALNIVYYGWRGNPQFAGFSLDAETVSRIGALGAEIAFDIYALGPDLPDEEPEDSSPG